MGTVTKNGRRRDIISGFILSFLGILNLFPVSAQTDDKRPEEQFIVVIDAGHGGKDPGALGSSSREKDIVLAIALKTGKYITDNLKNVKVVYTRNKDVFVELRERGQIANRANADLFISIHANSTESGRTVRGAETFILGHDKDAANLAVAMKENEVILLEDDYSVHYSGFDPKSPESYIIFSLMQNVYKKQSIEFAALLQDQFRERLGRVDRGVKQGPFQVLVGTAMPSVLVEVGFISNADEEKFLKSAQGQDYLASAIFRAFRDYKNGIDRRSGFNTVRDEPVNSSAATNAPANPASVSSNEELFFTVQIASTKEKKEPVPANFKGLGDLNEIAEPDRYRYASGRFKSYQNAVDYRKNISDKYPDAFVIAFKGSKVVPLAQAIEMAGRK
jgi:N-acetylmuramoyl-L-alanine amidase